MVEANPSETLFEIEFEPVGRRGRARRGQTLLAAAQDAGVQLVAVCGGAGICGTCRVRCRKGQLTPASVEEQEVFGPGELEMGWRLACRARIDSDVQLDIPPTSLATAQRLQLEGSEVEAPFDPPVTSHEVFVDPPGPLDLRSDWSRLSAALSDSGIGGDESPLSVVRHCSERLRALDWHARVVVGRRRDKAEIVAVLSLDERPLGLAFDIGTTKVAAYLVDLTDGRTIGRAGTVNPQITFGDDVVSRIAYANEGEEQAALLRSRIIETLNDLAAELLTPVKATRHVIADVVVVGNTAMHHILTGLSVRQLGEAPYVPAMSGALNVFAGELGLLAAPGTRVYLPPGIAGYVGGDHVSMLVAGDVRQRDAAVVALDIGTNTEISLQAGGRLVTCSCASGPAFEGAHIRDGMRALPGAVERVQVSDGVFHVQTVGGRAPVGICGSGILDAVASMLDAGVIDERGSLREGHPRVERNGDGLRFILVPAIETEHGNDIVITRKDVHEIQLAKGAVRAGIEILLSEADLSASEIDTLVVAGAFGTYLDLDSAVRIGMFPELPADRFEQVGNAAGMGAIRMLRSRAARRSAEATADVAEYIELTTQSRFTDVFTDALFFTSGKRNLNERPRFEVTRYDIG